VIYNSTNCSSAVKGDNYKKEVEAAIESSPILTATVANVTDEEEGGSTLMGGGECGGADLDADGIAAFKSCSFWGEGVAMSFLGLVAVITNVISIYVFTR